MPKIKVEHPTSLSQEHAFSKIKEFFKNNKELNQWDPNIEYSFQDAKKQGTIKGKQFKGHIAVHKNKENSDIYLEIDLPILLLPFKGKVEEMMKKKLKKYFA